jgi:aryl-alcohol dehydrogenase-like predicted oxidoreductase
VDHRPLGRSGIQVSRFGLGTMVLGAAELRLDADVLDAIDAIVAPAITINDADLGWKSPGLARHERRRR